MTKIEALRSAMVKAGIDAYLVPSFDAHQSEYVADYFKTRQWLTDFTGSAGTAVVTLDHAGLWTDGRYHTQAERELLGGPFELVKQGLPGAPTFSEWISTHLSPGGVIGFDGTVFSQGSFEQLSAPLLEKGFSFNFERCLLEPIWLDRPAFPKAQVMDFPLAYAGQSRTEKLARVRSEMARLEAQAYIIPNLDDIAWLMNIRGGDIAYCPFVIAYLLITESDTTLFVHEEKLPADLVKSFAQEGILLKSYETVFEEVQKLPLKKFMCDPLQMSAKLFASLPVGSKVVAKGDVVTRFKASKSEVELQNIRNSQVKDGVALVNFLDWLEEAVPKGGVTELDIASQLVAFRSKQALFLQPSFNTIAGYGANAAMMHYGATEENHATLASEGFLLFDSGAQYMDGTTDITRTVALGPVSEEACRDYTLTLKSHIGLARAVFLKGTCGPHLDILARRPMWENGLDYKCGTGHGLGYVLSVHEGPHTIRCNQNDVPLEIGMLITNEPGVYKPGRHGIRIENTLLVSLNQETEFGTFYDFETISYCPIDTTPLILSLMSSEEIAWLNHYHKGVFDALSPFVEGRVLDKLTQWTKAI